MIIFYKRVIISKYDAIINQTYYKRMIKSYSPTQDRN